MNKVRRFSVKKTFLSKISCFAALSIVVSLGHVDRMQCNMWKRY